VVTLYDKKAEVKGAFSAAAGRPAAGKAGEPGEGTGVSAAAVAGVADLVRAGGADTSAAQERYDRESLSVVDGNTDILPLQERSVFKIVLGCGGLAGFGLGMAMMIHHADDTALVVSVSGLMVAMTGLFIPNANLEPDELREAVDKYNGGRPQPLRPLKAPSR